MRIAKLKVKKYESQTESSKSVNKTIFEILIPIILMENNIHIANVFEESSCCLCGRNGVDQYIKVTENFIKYGQKLVSFCEVIQETLDFEVSSEKVLKVLEMIQLICCSRQKTSARWRYASGAKESWSSFITSR